MNQNKIKFPCVCTKERQGVAAEVLMVVGKEGNDVFYSREKVGFITQNNREATGRENGSG